MSFPDFATFYQEAYGYPPFPWQARLADDVLQNGWNGLLLDLPTGSGKTAAMDVALYCLACAPERLPRRTVLVVDRRVVVDQAGQRARHLQDKLDKAENGPLKIIADRLRSLTGDTRHNSCLSVAIMRGGMPRDNDWAQSPDLPVLGVSTVDQVGSRLLFRGYGLNDRSAPLHAALLGNDTLILLDEVHLARPFAQTLQTIEKKFRFSIPGLPERFAAVPMSATVSDYGQYPRRFQLAQEDRDNIELSQRLSACKRVALKQLKVSGPESQRCGQVAQECVKEALELQKNGAKVVAIVVNRVDTARDAAKLIDSHHKGKTEFELVTGRMRPIDRDRLTRTLLERVRAGRQRSPEERPLIVVATQCIEAGADFDFDAIVTECASLDALRQRFGRVDRLGKLGSTQSVLVGRTDSTALGARDPIYGEALSCTWIWLMQHAHENSIDFGIGGWTEAEAGEALALVTPSREAPVMLPAHLDAWVQTNLKPAADPDPSLWLHGPECAQGDVQVIWREGLDCGTEEDVFHSLETVRPSSLESVSLPLTAVRRWLANESVPAISDLVSEGTHEQSQSGGRSRPAFRWTGDQKTSGWLDEPGQSPPGIQLRPGDVVLVDSALGGLKFGSFDPECGDSVPDLGDLAQIRGRGKVCLRLFNGVPVSAWGLIDRPGPIPSEDETKREYHARVCEWIKNWPAEAPPNFLGESQEWNQSREGLSEVRWGDQNRIGETKFICFSKKLAKQRMKPDYQLEDRLAESVTESEEGSLEALESIGQSLPGEISLREHCDDVRKICDRYARNLNFSDALVRDLCLAATFHDVGKADTRFQMWLLGGDEVRLMRQKEPVAKSAHSATNNVQRELARQCSRYPKGYRHELLSVAMLEQSDDALKTAIDRELVLHLVAVHHGWCRPNPPLADDLDDDSIELQHEGVKLQATYRHRLARLDSGVAERFWNLTERYGWWELAWLETILRLADHNASEQKGSD